ncbi:MAG TPA: ABC-2 family transporter protein [Bacillota bacterium]|nr:ABC-2 family transporter protein [Bacillota bacterium]
MSGFQLYFRYLKANFHSQLQYKGWPIQIIMVLFHVMTDPLAVLLLFSRFGNIGGWTVERVMLVYGMAVTSFGLAEVFSRGFDSFPWQVRTGAFDRILLRPRSTVVQVMGMRFHLHRLSRVLGGGFMIGWSLFRQGVSLNPEQLIQLSLALAGGYLTYTGVFIFISAFIFWTIQPLNWIYLFTNCSYQVTKCPPSLLPHWLRNTFIFVMPMLVFSYYPAAAICGWGIPPVLGWLAFPAGALFLLLSLALWRVGVRFYTSTGS